MIWSKNLQPFGPIAFGHSPSYSSDNYSKSPMKSIITTTVASLPTPPSPPLLSTSPLRSAHGSSTPLPAPDYSQYTISCFLPFAINNEDPDAPPMNTVPYMRLSFEQEDVVVAVDTGSTGFMYSAADLKTYDPSWEETYEQGWQYLNSSKLLYVGLWVPVNVSFPDAVNLASEPEPNSSVIDLTQDGFELKARSSVPTSVVSSIKILVVTKKVKVPDYVPSEGPNFRPGGKNVFPVMNMPKGIRYLGVGFGRQDDGMPQSGPDKNVLLNIVSVDGKRVIPSSSYSYSSGNRRRNSNRMRTGYIVTKTGIHVGLTESNCRRFNVQKLKRRQGGNGDGRDWSMARMCVSVDDQPCAMGNLLVDTGIRQSYMTVPSSMNLRRHPQENPSSGATSKVLDDGSTVNIDFGSAGSYNFTVGSGAVVEPRMVCTTSSDKREPFVNTGCHFLRKFDIMFDADPARGGWFGVREGW